MNVFDHPEFDNHEQVVFCNDKESGLKAIIAIHNTNLGPGAGGIRMWNYANFDDALYDVLRLSKGMSYKNAIAGLACGGGKSVIIGDSKMPFEEKEAMFRAFARFLQSLSGCYYAAEDVGTSVEVIRVMMDETDYVFGLPDGTGDPSPFTALGVFQGIKAAVKYKLGRDDLKAIKVAVQGVGHVGYYLCEHLHEAGAELFVSDINQDALDKTAADFGATIVEPEAIYGLDVDVYAPCALGATINDKTIPQLKAPIVAGAANNQLKEAHHGDILHEKGILYAPDYVINVGGMINASGDITGNYSREAATEKTMSLYNTLIEIFEESNRSDTPTYIISDKLAEEKLQIKQVAEPAIGD
jgi:leucine dehydrogenase